MPEDSKLEIQTEVNVTKLIANSRDALEGLIKLSQGGSEALSGLALEGTVVTEVFESMLGPLAPVLMAITSIAAIAIPLWEQYNDKLKEATQDEEDFGLAAKNAWEAGKPAMEAAVTALQDYLSAQKQSLDEEKESADYNKQKLTDLEAQHEATTKLALAQLELQKQTELASSHGDKERDAITVKYKVKEDEVKGASTDQKYSDQKTAIETEMQANTDQRHQIVAQTQDEHTKLDTLTGAVTKTTKIAGDDGYSPDATGSFAAAIDAQTKIATEAARVSSETFHGKNQSSPIIRHQLEFLQKQAIAEGTKLANLQDAEKAHEELAQQGPDLQSAIVEGDRQEGKFLDQNDSLARQEETLGILYKATKTTEQAEGIRDGAKSSNDTGSTRGNHHGEEAPSAGNAATNANSGPITPARAADTPGAPPSLVTATAQPDIASQITQLQQQIDQLEANQAKNPQLSGVINYEIQQKQDQLDSLYGRQADQNKDKPDTVVNTLKKDDTTIPADSEGAINELDPSGQHAQAAQAAVQLLEKGHAEGGQQLEEILNQLLGTATRLTEAQAGRYARIITRLQEVDAELNKLHGKADAALSAQAGQ